MINLNKYLYEKVKPIIAGWDEQGIYAISFFVYSNEAWTYQEYKNISEFAISYNTEEDYKSALKYTEYSEARWNYAFWRQNATHIIKPSHEGNEELKVLFQWYKENGIENIGFESHNHEDRYDGNFNYIGKGPVGYMELLDVVSDVARQLQTEGFISEKFGAIPIIVHDLEYPWYIGRATENANPNKEADIFLKALKQNFVSMI